MVVLPTKRWRHVPSKKNPADISSRGVVHISVPEELPSTCNHRDRWEFIQNIKRGFWKKWNSDFLTSLQPHMEWQDAQPNLKKMT
ncbi:hypothetical protein TNCV_950041 [Trichonephila clavipes]|nr:hypothetical protein TNCV_950041 [Trichonephila clavipes]